MRVFVIIFCILTSFLLWTCQNIEDASPSKRNTFIHLYEGAYDITANDMIAVADGYVVVGEMSVPPTGSAVDSIVTVVIKADINGNQVGDIYIFQGGSGKSIAQHPNGGYIIVGDRIKKDLNPANVADGIISSARILVLDNNFVEQFSITKSGPEDSIKTDFYGGSVTIDPSGEVIVLGTYVKGGSGNQTGVPERPFLLGFTKSGNTLTLDWEQDYDLIDRNYKNSKSVHVNTNNNIIWASGIARIQGDVTFSYVSIPVVEPNSVFTNNSTLGEINDQLFSPSDIQPAHSSSFGYGVVGSYSEPTATDGSKSNMFFLKVDALGNIIHGSERFFDAVLSSENVSIDSTLSEIIDEGLAITSTSDGGFVLAGSMLTIPTKGNGARDIFLVKLNAFGDPVWNTTIGGSGDEVVSSILESADGGLLICGTNNLAEASTVFLIKTDKNGELKN